MLNIAGYNEQIEREEWIKRIHKTNLIYKVWMRCSPRLMLLQKFNNLKTADTRPRRGW